MECKFHVGQKVVCVEETVIPEECVIGRMPMVPVVGNIYEIREILIGDLSGKPCLRFHEIPNEDVLYIVGNRLMEGVPAWEAHAFRPLITRKTDISVFTAMLAGQKVSVPA